MDSKLIFCFAFASLTASVFCQSSIASYGLSEEDAEPLRRIMANQDPSLYSFYDGYNPMFDIIEKFTYVLIDTLEDPSRGNYSTIPRALFRSKEAVDSYLNSVIIVLGNTTFYDAIEVARNSSYADLENAYESMTDALKLAEAGFPDSPDWYYEYRADVEVYQNRTQVSLENMISNIFDSIRTCLATSDDDILAEIQYAQEGTNLGMVQVNNALFNALKVYAQEFVKGYSGVSVIPTLEQHRTQATTALQDLVAYEYSILRTIYILSKQDEADISVAGLNRNQQAMIVSMQKGFDATYWVFNTLSSSLGRVFLGLYDDGRNSYSATDIAEDKTLFKFENEFEAIVESISFVHPDAADKISAVEENVSNILAQKNSAYYGAIRAVYESNSNFTESLAQIEAFRTAAISLTSEQVDSIYGLIRNGETWDEASEEEFTSYQEAAYDLFDTYVNTVFDTAIEQLKAINASLPDADNYRVFQLDLTDYFTTSDLSYNVALGAMNTINLHISEAGFVALKANSAE